MVCFEQRDKLIELPIDLADLVLSHSGIDG